MTRPPEERDLIPYEPSVFAGRRVLGLAAHADDEVFGFGGAIAALNGAGASVDVAVFTDGAWDEPDAAARARIAEARLGESRAALDLLGGARVRAIGLPDRGLRERRDDAEKAILHLLGETSPDLIFVPSPVEVHPDHRALADAFLGAARRGAARESIQKVSVAFYELSQPIRPNFLLDLSGVAAAKDGAMAAFVSQNTGRDYPAYIRGLNAYRRMTLALSVTAAEGYYVVSGSELLSRSDEDLARVMGPALPRAEGRRGLLRRLLTGRA